ADRWTMEFKGYVDDGTAELVWAASVPLLAALLGFGRRQAYLVWFSGLLLVGLGNPFLYDLVTGKAVPASVYFRILWLFPVGPGLGVLIALMARLAGKVAWGSVAGQSVWAPLAATGLGLMALLGMPGKGVWDEKNDLGPFMAPRYAENLEKAPPD